MEEGKHDAGTWKKRELVNDNYQRRGVICTQQYLFSFQESNPNGKESGAVSSLSVAVTNL